jgi:hypothetical protein
VEYQDACGAIIIEPFVAFLRVFQSPNAATHSILKLPLIPVNVATLWW